MHYHSNEPEDEESYSSYQSGEMPIGLYSEQTHSPSSNSIIKYLILLVSISIFFLISTKQTITTQDSSQILSFANHFGTSPVTDDNVSTAENITLPDFANTTKPNFVFILADDLGWNSMGYFDNYDMEFATPFLTKLAESGIILKNYYAQETCVPSRAALLTGRYPLTVGMQFHDVDPAMAWGLNTSEVLLSEVLSDNGYVNYLLGKWDLGHFTPLMLPTARGFDYFMGYLTGETYYWSKRQPNNDEFYDLMYANKDCYDGYNGTDMHEYSTFLYRDKAIRIIETHDFDANPMFLYFASQAVHDPYSDILNYFNGIPVDYVGDETYNKVMVDVVGRKRRQYAFSLVLLDQAVEKIYNALERVGQINNTYIIFSSDNGGCYEAGGRNGPLRGSKGSLFEGGIKVDAFIHSPLISSSHQGKSFNGLMHISDWFPTILDLAGISYFPPHENELDGSSQYLAIAHGSQMSQRGGLLYNFYIDVESDKFNMWANGPVGVRDDQYKLLHAFDDNPMSKWYKFAEALENDDSLRSYTCSQASSMSGNFTYFLFDLENDPYEEVNLYDDPEYEDIKESLYNEMAKYRQRSRTDISSSRKSKRAFNVWKSRGDFIGPWVNEEDLEDSPKSFPRHCAAYSVVSPLDQEYITLTSPTRRPTAFWNGTDDGLQGDQKTHQPTMTPLGGFTHAPTSTSGTVELISKGEVNSTTDDGYSPTPSSSRTFKPSSSPDSIITSSPTREKPTLTRPTSPSEDITSLNNNTNSSIFSDDLLSLDLNHSSLDDYVPNSNSSSTETNVNILSPTLSPTYERTSNPSPEKTTRSPTDASPSSSSSSTSTRTVPPTTATILNNKPTTPPSIGDQSSPSASHSAPSTSSVSEVFPPTSSPTSLALPLSTPSNQQQQSQQLKSIKSE